MADASYIVTDTDAAWAAGFLDGEGNFALKSRRGGRDRSPYICASQISLAPLEKLVDMFGGKIYSKNPAMGNKSQCWQWDLFGAQNIVRVVPVILPYLVRKGDEARLVYEYARTMGAQGRSVGGNVFILSRRKLIVDSYNELRAA